MYLDITNKTLILKCGGTTLKLASFLKCTIPCLYVPQQLSYRGTQPNGKYISTHQIRSPQLAQLSLQNMKKIVMKQSTDRRTVCLFKDEHIIYHNIISTTYQIRPPLFILYHLNSTIGIKCMEVVEIRLGYCNTALWRGAGKMYKTDVTNLVLVDE